MSQEDFNKGVKAGQEAKRILLSLICGGGVGILIVLIIEKFITTDIRILLPIITILFVANRNSIFK